MPSKYTIRNFKPGYFYHIYNRGTNKSEIFKDRVDYENFLDIVAYYIKFPTGKPYSKSPLIQDPILDSSKWSFEMACYCLMPNHFHFLIKQKADLGKHISIGNFMRRTMIAYAMYFNDKYNHSGNIFQGKYKNVQIISDNQLLYVTKYIHLNIKDKLESYPYSSYQYYLVPKSAPEWLNTNEVLNFFTSNMPGMTYKDFINDTEFQLESAHNLLMDE